jgi:heme-degrading monooxygenase HmoA
MVTYIATIYAKPGHELEVTQYYQDLEPQLKEAKGYRGRRIYRARPGTMEAEIRRVIPADQLKGHPEEGPPGVHFIMVEEWDSVADRIAFSRSASNARGKELFSHILPQHSHEFYEDVTPR